jgi:hypothetical protein
LEEPTDYASFLVRLWRRRELEPPQDAAGWQGEVEHVQSGQRWSFDTLERLLTILCSQIEEDAGLPELPAGE